MSNKRLLCLGDANVDIIVPYGEALEQRQSELAREANIRITSGGPTANTVCGLGLLGRDPIYIAKIGNDHFGRLLLNDIARCGVDSNDVVIDNEHSTMYIIAVLDSSGERTFFLPDGEINAAQNFRPEDVAPDIFDRFDIVHLSGATLIDDSYMGITTLDFAQKARYKNKTILFDLNLRIGSNRKLDPAYYKRVHTLLPLADHILGSVNEFQIVFEDDNVESIGSKLAQQGKVAIIRNGVNPVIIHSPTVRQMIPSAKGPEKIVDTIGAGDNFNSGYMAALEQGLDMPTCVKWANTAAAYSLAAAGGKGGPTMAQLRHALKESYNI